MRKYIILFLLWGIFGNAQYNLFARQNFAKSTNGFDFSGMGLMAYYKLQNNANDSYSTHNGTAYGITYTAGKIGNCGVFSDVGANGVIIPNTADLQLSTGTLSCWIKTSAAGSSYRGVFGKQLAYMIFLVDGVLSVYNWGSFGGSELKTTGINLNDGLWHHIYFIFESGTANNYIYIDNVLQLTFSWSVSAQTSDVSIGLGIPSGFGQIFNGTIDSACIFNTKLTATQRTALYNFELAGKDPLP